MYSHIHRSVYVYYVYTYLELRGLCLTPRSGVLVRRVDPSSAAGKALGPAFVDLRALHLTAESHFKGFRARMDGCCQKYGPFLGL